MNKRELSKIDRPVETEELLSLARRVEKEKYLVTAERLTISGEKILLLNFFERSQIKAKKSGAAFRTFISQDDYITQDLKDARIKWRTGSLKNIVGWYWWCTRQKGHDTVFASDEDLKNVETFIQKFTHDGDDSIWEAVTRFQDSIMEKRLETRRKKETDKFDKQMELVPEIPPDFKQWVHEFGLYKSRYMIYDAASRKKQISAYCTHCKKSITLDERSVRPRHGKLGICPNCNSDITFKAKGKMPAYLKDDEWVCLVQKIATGIVARYFKGFMQFDKEKGFRESFACYEYARIFYEDIDQKGLKVTAYEWAVYKQRGHSRWCPSDGNYRIDWAILYLNNLLGELKDTVYQYSALDLLQTGQGWNTVPIRAYMDAYPRRLYLEYLVKMKLTQLACDEAVGKIHLNSKGKSPVEILKLPKDYINALIAINGGSGHYSLLKQCISDKVLPQAVDIKDYFERFGANDELIGVINIHMSIRKFIRYIDKQMKVMPIEPEPQGCHTGWMSARPRTKAEKQQEKYKNLAKDWLDYISWCAQLKYNMNDNYVLLPPDFKKAHDRVMKEYQDRQDEMVRRRKIQMEKMIKAALKQAADVPAMMMRYKDLMIILPKDAEEIKQEGRVLHHCVGTYVERVARGETMILFVRRIEAPEEPYFTLEYRDKKVVQCRGKNNCAMNDKVKAFVKAFEIKLSEAEKEGQKKNRKKVG